LPTGGSCYDIIFYAGKKTVMLEVSTEEKTKASARLKRGLGSSGLELKLDELRKELSSNHGGILPHSVLSTQQISLLCSQKPKSLEEASFIHVLLVVR
jgi:ATP-dependent DNA helicase Q1